MKARAIQLAARYIGWAAAALTSALGVSVDAGAIESIAVPIATGLTALAGILVDHYIHRLREKSGLPL